MYGGDCQVMQSSSLMMVGGGGVGGGGVGLLVENMAAVTSSDHFFSSPIRNPSSGFSSFMASLPPFHAFSAIVPKEEMGMVRQEEEMESGGSGSGHVEGVSCGEERDNSPDHRQQSQQQQPQKKKKRYHRHTAIQIQEMEALFKEYPHPDDKQRMKLSQDLGLKPRQVKFWFQNRRTQMKAQQDRSDNLILRAENENLKSENFRLQVAMRSVVCPSCGGAAMLAEISFDEQHLRLENARLKDELERLSCLASRYGSRTMQSLGPAPPMFVPSLDLDMGNYSKHFTEPPMEHCTDVFHRGNIPPDGDHHHQLLLSAGCMIMDQDKPLVLDLAMTAAQQLVEMCSTDEPLWVKSGGGKEGLDVEEYEKMFPWRIGIKNQNAGDSRVEATRDSALVIMNSITLVDAFMDVEKWMDMFPSIISSAKTIQVISPGLSGHGNGSLLLIYAELQALSPLVPTRATHFFRYCQQNEEEKTWTIVDFPVDGFLEGLQEPFPNYRRRPSGCVIQDMPNGYSKVTWVEHTEVDGKPVHQIFDKFVRSGMAFGAQRWLADLQRHCEMLASLLARNISDLGVIPTADARANMMKLSQRMVRTFGANISPSGGQSWTALSESPEDSIRVTTRKNTEHGQPSGIILSAVSTTWLPFSHQQVFDLLTDEQRRSQLDILSSGYSLNEVAHIANGSHPRNCVSLLRINASSNSSQSVELMLQESSTHPYGGSLVVYANIDIQAVQVVMSGNDTSYVPILPIGFIVLPANLAPTGGGVNSQDDSVGPSNPTGCLLTVGLQVLTSAVLSAKLNLSSVTAINNHLCNAVHQIGAALGGSVPTDPVAATTTGDQ